MPRRSRPRSGHDGATEPPTPLADLVQLINDAGWAWGTQPVLAGPARATHSARKKSLYAVHSAALSSGWARALANVATSRFRSR